MKTLIFLALLLSACISTNSGALAASAGSCVTAEVTDSHGVKLTFTQQTLENGAYDLVITQFPDDIKRVTFEQANTCTYQALAIAEGVGWGWHLAWADTQILYIARMDGEAWVSSVPKKFAAESARKLHFSQNEHLLQLSWQAADGEYSIQSDDDGRSWSAPTKH